MRAHSLHATTCTFWATHITHVKLSMFLQYIRGNYWHANKEFFPENVTITVQNEQNFLCANLFLINKCVSLKFADFVPKKFKIAILYARHQWNKVSHVNYVFWWFFFTITLWSGFYHNNRKITLFCCELQRPKDWAMKNILIEIEKVLEIKLPFTITTSFSSRNITFAAYEKKVNFFSRINLRDRSSYQI